MNILVTGGNGFVGRALCESLSKTQHHVSVLVRKPSPCLPAKNQVIVSDFLNEKDWAFLKGIDVVIHTAGLAHEKGRPDQDYYDINTEITKTVALECVKYGVKRFVFLSTLSVYGVHSSSETLSLKTPVNPLTPYGKSKLQAEMILHEIEKDLKLEVVILRPPLVYGRQAKGNADLLIKAIRKNLPLPFAGVHNKRSLIYIENLVSALLLSATHPEAKGNTYLVSDDHSLSIEDLIQGLAKGLGRSPLLFPFPEILLRALLKLIGKEDFLEKIIGSLEVDINGIKKSIGWKPVVSVEEGLRRTTQV